MRHAREVYDRRFVISPIENAHGYVGTVLFSLDGSPPKAYAMYIPELQLVNFYDGYGKRFRAMTNTRLELSKEDITHWNLDLAPLELAGV
ncbi:MAG: hypothetical protein ACE5OZ_23155 [Candidatus Heimdallarchaeota archaeon]